MVRLIPMVSNAFFSFQSVRLSADLTMTGRFSSPYDTSW